MPTKAAEEAAPETDGTGDAEFFSDQQRDNHVRALEKELAGYEQRVVGAERKGDDDDVKLYKIRAGEVRAEIDRITGDSKPTRRGRKKSPDQPESGE